MISFSVNVECCYFLHSFQAFSSVLPPSFIVNEKIESRLVKQDSIGHMLAETICRLRGTRQVQKKDDSLVGLLQSTRY